MTKDKVLDLLREVFHDVVTDDVRLEPETSAKDVPEWDSLAHIRLILAIERAFGIKLVAAEIGKLANVAGLVDLIASKTSS